MARGFGQSGSRSVVLADGKSLDAFGRMRVSQPYTVFDSKLLAGDDSPLLWDESLESGSGITASTPTAAKPYIDFTSTDTTAGKFTRQTRRRFVYQPGKSQLVLCTGVLDLSGGGTGVERRIGLFDDNNGLFFEQNAGTVGVTTRSNDTGTPVDTTVAQTAWNLDKMDGSGPSGITADFTQSQIFTFDFQWLSIGRVRFGLNIGGSVYYVHELNQANVSAIPWASTPNLPVRYQMITTASSPVATMRCICASVISEGGFDPQGILHSHATTQHVNGNSADVWYALLGVQLKAAVLGCEVTPVSMSSIAETNDKHELALFFNPTVDGTFTYGDLANSCCQVATGNTDNPSTNTVTGGTKLASAFVSTAGSVTIDLSDSIRIGALIDGTRDDLVLAARPLSTNADIQGSLTWSEKL